MPTTTTRAPQPGDILPFTATEATLANGLKVIVVPTGFPNLVSGPDTRRLVPNEVGGKSGSPISSST
jgi:hypothetical protein